MMKPALPAVPPYLKLLVLKRLLSCAHPDIPVHHDLLPPRQIIHPQYSSYIEKTGVLVAQEQMLQSHKHKDRGHNHSISPSEFYYVRGSGSGIWGQGGTGEYAWTTRIGIDYANLGNAVAYGDSGTVSTGSENRPKNFTIKVWKRVS